MSTPEQDIARMRAYLARAAQAEREKRMDEAACCGRLARHVLTKALANKPTLVKPRRL